MREIQDLICCDLGMSCAEAHDPKAFEGETIDDDDDGRGERAAHLTEYYACLSAREEEVFLTRPISRKQAYSPEQFGTSGFTWLELAKKAVEKELGKFREAEVLGDAQEEADVMKQFPDVQFVWLNMIFTVKFWELGWTDRVLGMRFVACGNMQYEGASGLYTDGSEEGETALWSAPPPLSAVRVFVTASALVGHYITAEDFKGAYLTAELKGPVVFAHLPEQARSEAEKLMRRPVRRVHKAVYGMKRSGHDFDAHARNVFAELGWESLRSRDSEPSLYTRALPA